MRGALGGLCESTRRRTPSCSHSIEWLAFTGSSRPPDFRASMQKRSSQVSCTGSRRLGSRRRNDFPWKHLNLHRKTRCPGHRKRIPIAYAYREVRMRYFRSRLPRARIWIVVIRHAYLCIGELRRLKSQHVSANFRIDFPPRNGWMTTMWKDFHIFTTTPHNWARL